MQTIPQSAAMLMLLAGCTAASVSPAGFSVTNLRTEYLENPLGLDKARPRFSWELKFTMHTLFVAHYLANKAGATLDLVSWPEYTLSKPKPVERIANQGTRGLEQASYRLKVGDWDSGAV
eukprot:gene26145-10614_t